jgi:hypothetical protein
MSIALESSDTPSAQFRFFIYDPEGNGFSYWQSPEARDEAKDNIIQAYLDDGWDDTVEQIVAGEVTHTCQKIDVQPRPDVLDDKGNDSEGNYWDESWAYRCNYDLLPLTA